MSEKRRRALMKMVKDNPIDYGTPFLSPFTEWHRSGIQVLSDNSAQLKNGGNNYYMYSAGTDGMLYSELVGKTVVIDFDMAPDSCASVQVGAKTNNTAGYGISSLGDRKTIANTSGNPAHYHSEIKVGTDYTTTTPSRYFIVAIRANAVGIVSNFKCGWRQDT